MAAAPERVTPGAGGADRVVFDVEVPPLAFDTLAADAGLRLRLPGYAADGPVGAPGIPLRVLMVAVPPEGAVTIAASGADPRVRDGITLAPVPLRARGSDGDVERYARDARAYAAERAGSGQRARLLGIAWMRNQRVAEIAIEPADYAPASRRLTLWSRVHVEVGVRPTAATVPAERNDPFERVYAGALVNYEQGRDWRRAAGAVVPARERRAGLARLATTIPDTSVFVGRDWVKIAVTTPGFYRLSYGALQSLAPFQGVTAPLNSVRLFTWPGYPVLPEGSYCDSCDYREVPFGILDSNSNGVFDTHDEIYFYAMGPSDWANRFDPSWPDTSYIKHPYETANAYFLTLSTATRPIPGISKRIAITSVDSNATVPALALATLPERVHYEVENEYFSNSPPIDGGTPIGSGTADSLVWQKWFWFSVNPTAPRQASFDLPDADTTQTVRVRFRLWGLSVPLEGFSFFLINFARPTLNGVTLPTTSWINKTSVTYDTTLANPRRANNLLSVTNVPGLSDPDSRIGLGFIEARYRRTLAPVHDSIGFTVPATGQRTLLRVGPFRSTAPPWFFDITDVNNPLQVFGAAYHALDDTTHELVFAVDGLTPRRFTMFPDFGQFPQGTVTAASRLSEVNLRRLGADYLVIYYDEFAAAAESLAAWRRAHLPLHGVPGPYVTRTVPISALYDQFSGGRTDPLAIRNFLRAAFYAGDTVGTGTSGGRRISYVSLLGDASFDFKDVYRRAEPGQPGCLLPTYENGYDPNANGGRKFTTDDWLANVDNAAIVLPDIFTGRIPVDDAATAMDVVRNKILFYERGAPFGEYRNNWMLIADDNTQCDRVDLIGWGHVGATADVDTLALPNHVDRTYVYLHKFPRASTESCLKPGARLAVQSGINRGVAEFSFVGHGSPFQLADEQVMVQTDVATLVNGPRYPLASTFSCDVGLFDDPTNQSLGERLLLRQGGGCFAVLSATELAFSDLNRDLDVDVHTAIFTRDSVSGQYENTLAEALLIGKLKGAQRWGPRAIQNNAKYQLLADAAAKFNLPHLYVDVTLQDSSGAPIQILPRGARVRYTGRVLSGPGRAPVPISGTASMLIQDEPPYETVPKGFYQYYDAPGTIYRGSATIQNGVVQGQFVVPLEARLGARGKVRAYVVGHGEPGRVTDDDGVGDLRAAVVPATGLPPDSTGPTILLSFPGGATQVRPDAVLQIRITDPSGVLITDHVAQNAIIVTVDGNSTARVDVTSSFRYEDGSYQSGTAAFPIQGLAVGHHRIQVSAADNLALGFSAAAHRSTAAIEFDVVETPALHVTRALLFPDPACSRCGARGGQFVVDVPGDSVNVLLRMYTVSGRLIRTLEWPGGIGRVQIPWDGLDEEHQPLANGVYLFRVNVNGRDPDGKSSARSHTVADGRFVIVNR